MKGGLENLNLMKGGVKNSFRLQLKSLFVRLCVQRKGTTYRVCLFVFFFFILCFVFVFLISSSFCNMLTARDVGIMFLVQ